MGFAVLRDLAGSLAVPALVFVASLAVVAALRFVLGLVLSDLRAARLAEHAHWVEAAGIAEAGSKAIGRDHRYARRQALRDLRDGAEGRTAAGWTPRLSDAVDALPLDVGLGDHAWRDVLMLLRRRERRARLRRWTLL